MVGARQFVALGLRLFAIWLCVGALQFYAITLVLKRALAAWGDSPWVGSMVALACVVVALILWLLSGPIARVLMSGLGKTPSLAKPSDAGLSAAEIVAVGCVLMGLWWLKESVVAFVTLWLRATSASSDAGQSALTWLGGSGEVDAAMDLVQIGIGLFFVCRPYRIAQWMLRHAPVISDAAGGSSESFDVLLRRATELGVRQVARPDIVDRLVELLALHPEHVRRLPELQELLRYKPNPLTRSTSARAIVLIGAEAARAARNTAADQLAEEDVPEVASDLATLVALAESHPAAGLPEFSPGPASHEGA